MEGVDARVLERFFQNVKNIAESLESIADSLKKPITTISTERKAELIAAVEKVRRSVRGD